MKRGALLLLLPLAALALPLLARPQAPTQEAPTQGAPTGAAPKEAAQEAPPQEQESPEPIEDVSDATKAQKGARPLLPLASTTEFSSQVQQRQSPFFFARPDGRALLGCLGSRLGQGDQIELRDVTDVAGPSENVAVRRVNALPAEIVRPTGVVDAHGRLVLIWTELVDGRAQLRVAREQKEGFTPPVTLTSGPAPNLNPEATLHADGKVWVAWETDLAHEGGRPSRDVVVAPLEERLALGTAVRVGDGRWSDLDACITSAGSQLWIVWTGYRGRDYEVMARSLDPASGKLSEPVDVSSDAQGDDVHAAIAAGKDGDLWIAWDRVAIGDRGSSLPPELRGGTRFDQVEVEVRCACLRGGRVLLPKSAIEGVADGVVAGAPLLSTAGGQPRLALDKAGRLWIAYRYLYRVPNKKSRYGYPLLVQKLGASGWSQPQEVEDSAGISEAPALLADGDAVLVAFETDDRVEMRRRRRINVPEKMVEPLLERGVVCSRWNGVAGIGLARAQAEADAAAPAEPEIALVERPLRLDPPHFHPAGAGLDDPLVNGDRHFEVARGEQRWSVFWGDLHRHSNVSRCSIGFEPTPEDRWTSGRDVHLCDFMALTDHTGAIDPFAWWQLDKLGWLHQSATFCTLLGWEWSTYEWGHHNVILRGRMAPMVSERSDIDALFKSLPAGECVTIPHHSSDVQFPNDFAPVDDRFTRLIEIYQACRGNFEFDGCFRQGSKAFALGHFVQDALQQGHKFGIIASSDHGFGQSYACVLAEKLDRESIFQALYARRTYGATTKGMLVDFRIEDRVMGEELAVACAKPEITVKLAARGSAELADVVVFKDGALFQSLRKPDDAARSSNSFAPIRLIARLTPKTAAGAAPLQFPVRVPDAHFAVYERARGEAERKGAPAWSTHGDEAVFTLPAGFVAPDQGQEFPIHLFAPAGARLELPRADRGVTFVTEAGDATVDLAKGLGTREFHGEWKDADARPGSSWYYARILQVDGEMAWSSPIFVTRK